MKAYIEVLLDKIRQLEADNLGLKHELNNYILRSEDMIDALQDEIKRLRKLQRDDE